MAHAYAPGLTVSESTIFRTERRLPLKGRVVVNKGDRVSATQIVARTDLPGVVHPLNVAAKMGIHEKEVPAAMLVKEGDAVTHGQLIAKATSFFGLFTKEAFAPTTGTMEAISKVTGQVMVRAAPIPVELNAFVDGTVVEVIENEGVVIETLATFIQGIFGIGGECQGPILVKSSAPTEVLDAGAIGPECEGKVILGGSLVTIEAIRKAISVKAKAIIAGGLNDQDLKDFLGYDLGVAITGNEDKGLTLVITEGFGFIPMAERTYRLLSGHAGKQVSVCGATQIRAGVMRPEIVVPLTQGTATSTVKKEQSSMDVGTSVRLIREPYFGRIARVVSLPVEPTIIETEAKVRVVEVELEDKSRVLLPRANVEIIEG